MHQAGDPGVAAALTGVWNGRLIDYPGGRTFQMTLEMNGDRVFGRITGEGTGGFGNVMGVYPGTGPVHLVADYGDGKQYSDGDLRWARLDCGHQHLQPAPAGVPLRDETLIEAAARVEPKSSSLR